MIEGIKRGGNIKFIGVARGMDKVLVASLTVQKQDSQEQYHTAVKEVLSAPDFLKKVQPGARYRLVGDVNAFNFTCDEQSRIYVVIAAQSYPERLVFPMINELVLKFKQEFDTPSQTCVAGALDGKAKRLFTALAEDYDDPTKRDKLANVQAQVQSVKETMHKNIDSIIQNIDKAKDIEESSTRLQDQAQRFDSQARAIKNREIWRKYKVTCMIVVGILALIAVLVLSFKPWQLGGGGSPSPAPGVATQPPVVTSPPTAPGGATAPPVVPP